MIKIQNILVRLGAFIPIVTMIGACIYGMQPVAPALAAKYTHGMVCKGLVGQYNDVIAVVDQHWKLPKNGQIQKTMLEAHEQELENFFDAIKKSNGFRSLDDYLYELSVDINIVDRWSKECVALPTDGKILQSIFKELKAKLLFVQALMQEHMVFARYASMLSFVQGSFNREISLLKTGQTATLAAYLRSSNRDYQRDLAVWIERFKYAFEQVRHIYPVQARNLATMLKLLEGLRTVYAKL